MSEGPESKEFDIEVDETSTERKEVELEAEEYQAEINNDEE